MALCTCEGFCGSWLLSLQPLMAPLLALEDADDVLPARCALLVLVRTLSLVSSGTKGSGRQDVFSDTRTTACNHRVEMFKTSHLTSCSDYRSHQDNGPPHDCREGLGYSTRGSFPSNPFAPPSCLVKNMDFSCNEINGGF